ncbi:MAG: hypothetical protein WBX27_01100 [Specibacter sp.]
MSESATPSPDDAPRPRPAGGPDAVRPAGDAPGAKAKMPVWLVRTILGAVAAVVLVVAYLIASVTVPLTWANAIKNQVGPQLGNSIPLGMFYGFVFSFVPVLVAWQAHHKRLHNWARVSLVALALVLTLPNLLTLGVLYGTSTSSVNARSIWNTGGANWFGAWSQSFMLVGIGCGIVAIILSRIWLRRGRKIRDIKAAEKLVRDTEEAKARAAKEAARVAEKAARDDARAAEKAGRVAAREQRRNGPAGPGAPGA